MTSIFAYQKKTTVNGQETWNDNFISFLNVISAYWQEREGGTGKVLSVFTPTYTFTFGEKTGERFLTEWNNFCTALAFGSMISSGKVAGASAHQAAKQPRRAVETPEDIVDEPNNAAPHFE